MFQNGKDIEFSEECSKVRNDSLQLFGFSLQTSLMKENRADNRNIDATDCALFQWSETLLEIVRFL